MDNVCHTLVGGALAESGLKRRTTLGAATLMIAANFPDIDIASLFTGHSLGFRRGITHGVPALIVLPFVLTALMLAWHRIRLRDQTAPDPRQLLVLSAIGMATHPVLDWMNTYGMRWLMPFNGTWSYGDALFIIDPWLWLALGIGVLWTRRRAGAGMADATGPARVAVLLSAAYVIAMVVSARQVRRFVSAELAGRGLNPVTVVADPVPVNPLRRRVIYQWADAYHFAEFRFLPRRLSNPYRVISTGLGTAEVALASRTRQGAEFLSWSRLPFFEVDSSGARRTVFMGDARYTLGVGPSWASTRVELP